MNNNTPPSPSSDSIYKRLYSVPRMVEDLLRSLFGDELGADYRTLEKLPAEYVGDALQQRRGDTARPSGRVGSLLRKLRSTVPALAAGCMCW